jgi:hypothetical protein
MTDIKEYQAMPNQEDTTELITAGQRAQQRRISLLILIFVHISTCFISLLYALHYTSHYVFYDFHQLPYAVGLVVAFSLIGLLFVFARFSFGYFVGFYFYTMVLGFLWLSCFTDLNYDHQIARLSAVASIIAFLLPALFVSSPLRPVFEVSPRAFERLLGCILALSVLTIAIAAIYNFRFVTLENISGFRAKLEFPTIVRYLIGIVSSALLPFAFACFVLQSKFWRAGVVLILLLLFYPITLTKLTFFTPVWLVGLGLLSKFFESRATAILSLLLPMLAGVILIILFDENARNYFDVVNFRMITIPSSAMNVYNDFFSKHDLTYFCQISILKSLLSCPYQEQLSIILERAYGLGNFNASLFATEGVASVGPLLAPAAVFLCGLVIALANRLSAGLPPRFILLSGAVLPQVFLNVPLTIALLTHGAGILFLLWYITPRAMFKQNELGAALPEL